jgi:hypothetical protein
MNKTSSSRSLCESCAHFHELAYFHELDKGQGRCHRYPPSFTASSSDIKIHHWQFPLVHMESWCGEYVAEDLDVEASLKNQ